MKTEFRTIGLAVVLTGLLLSLATTVNAGGRHASPGDRPSNLNLTKKFFSDEAHRRARGQSVFSISRDANPELQFKDLFNNSASGQDRKR